MTTASARLEVRVRPETKARIERAAALTNELVSDFVRSAVEERADRIVADYETQTRVPGEFFDALLAALDAPAQPANALARGARRARRAVTRA